MRFPITCLPVMEKNKNSIQTWADTRAALGNFTSSRLFAGILIADEIDEEFIDMKRLKRWSAETVRFSLDLKVLARCFHLMEQPLD